MQENPDLFQWLTGQTAPPPHIAENPAFVVRRCRCGIAMLGGCGVQEEGLIYVRIRRDGMRLPGMWSTHVCFSGNWRAALKGWGFRVLGFPSAGPDDVG